MRGYSSASAANAIDAGSAWTRRRNSSMRGLSATPKTLPSALRVDGNRQRLAARLPRTVGYGEKHVVGRRHGDGRERMRDVLAHPGSAVSEQPRVGHDRASTLGL